MTKVPSSVALSLVGGLGIDMGGIGHPIGKPIALVVSEAGLNLGSLDDL